MTNGGWRVGGRKDTVAGESGEGKQSRGRSGVKIGEDLLGGAFTNSHSRTHATHTHMCTRGVTLFSIKCDSCCPPDPCSYCGNGDRNYGGADR